MKHSLIGIIFATFIAVAFVSCREGDKGEPGPSGSSSPLLPYKSGSITGTLTGTSRLEDEDFTQNVNFQYFKSPSDNVSSIVDYEGDESIYSITRYDSLGGSYVKFEFSLDSSANQNGGYDLYLYNINTTIVVNKKLNNNVFYFGTCADGYYNPFNVGSIYLSDYSSGGNSNITVDNLVINRTTGLLTFDYSLELNYYDNSTGNNAYMDGTVSVTPYNVSYRQGAQ